MTTFLTFSVYSLRVAGDIPIQSEYLPLITLYFIISTVYTLISFMWFILGNYFMTNVYLPKFLIKICDFFTKSIKFFNSNQVNSNKKTDIESAPADLVEIKEARNSDQIELKSRISLSTNKTGEKEEIINVLNHKAPMNETKKDEKDQQKKKLESYVKKLNFIVFCLVFMFIFLFNLIIWCIIAI